MSKFQIGDELPVTLLKATITKVDDNDSTYKVDYTFKGGMNSIDTYVWVSQRKVDAMFEKEEQEPSYLERQKKWMEDNEVTPNTLFKVVRKAEDHEDGWDNSWSLSMDDFVGGIYPLYQNHFQDWEYSARGIGLWNENIEDFYNFPYFCLEVVKKDKEVEPDHTNNYEDKQDKWLKENDVQIGTRVIVSRRDSSCPGWKTNWVDAFYQKEGWVHKINPTLGIGVYNKDAEDWFWYPYTSLDVVWKMEETEKEKELKPGDLVLGRDTEQQVWKLDIYSCKKVDDPYYPYICISDNYEYCIPFSSNKHLLNTNKGK